MQSQAMIILPRALASFNKKKIPAWITIILLCGGVSLGEEVNHNLGRGFSTYFFSDPPSNISANISSGKSLTSKHSISSSLTIPQSYSLASIKDRDVPSKTLSLLPGSQQPSAYPSLNLPAVCKTIRTWIDNKNKRTEGCRTCIELGANKHCPTVCRKCPTQLPNDMLNEHVDGVPSGIPTSLPSSQPSTYPSLSVPEICKTIESWIKHREDQGCKTCISYGFNKHCPKICQKCSSQPPTIFNNIMPNAHVDSIQSGTRSSPRPSQLKNNLKQSTFPSNLPSLSPSGTQSSVPNATPSVLPSVMLSMKPSTFPSNLPSLSPSSTPSYIPSMTPSVLPSVMVSMKPSTFPSNLPSLSPSSTPSSIPSATPSVLPSVMVSMKPSTFPSNLPSLSPSSTPSYIPSMTPSVLPSTFPSSFPSTSPSVILTTSRVINNNTYNEGVRIYKKLSGSYVQDVFSVLLPQSNKMYLAGSVTISRCNSKDILGISHDQKTSPCFHTCGKGGLIRECYPELDKQTNDFFDPHLFAKIIVGGKNNNCNCEWTDLVCNKEMHHCTLVLPQCQCSNLNEKNIVAKVVVTANSDGQRVKDNYVVEIENGKGFLAAYSSVINKTKIVRDLIVKKPRYRAQYKDENTEEFFVKHFPVLQTQIPKTITGSKLMIARGTIDIKLDWDEKYHTKKDGRRDTCNPLVVARFIISENKLDSTSGPFNDTVAKMDFKNKSTQNCVWSDSVCKYKVIDFVPWEDNFINKWLVLVVGTKKSCIHPTNDYWEAYSGKVRLTIAV